MSSQAFLADIGAYDLSSATRDEAVVQPVLERITRQLDVERESLHSLIVRRLPEFSQHCQDAVSLTLKLSSVASHVQYNEQEIQRHTSKITAATSAHATLVQELAKYDALWLALSQIKEYQEALRNVHILVHGNQLREAAMALPAKQQTELWVAELPLWKQLDTQRGEVLALLKEKIKLATDECVRWQKPRVLRIQTRTQDGTSLPTLLDILTTFQLREAFLINLKQHIDSQLIQPYLQGSLSFAIVDDALALQEKPEAERLQSYPVLTRYLQERFPAVLDLLQPSMLDSLISKVLYPALEPSTSTEQLQNFQTLLSHALQFESSLVSSGPIARWADALAIHWVQKFNEHEAFSVRTLVVECGSSQGWEAKRTQWHLDNLKQAPFAAAQTSALGASEKVPSHSQAGSKSLEDDWELEGHTKSDSEPSASGVPVADEAESAWGLDEEPINIDEEGWGIDEPAIDLDNTEDAWGIDSTEAASADDTSAAWGWEQDSPVKPKTKRKLGAVRLSDLPPKAPLDASSSTRIDTSTPRKELTREATPAEIPPEHFSVSLHTDKVLNIAQGVLDRLQEVAVSDHFASLPPPHELLPRLQKTFLDVFDFYRATMPVQHAALIDNVPAIGMQFANDLELLAWQLGQLIAASTDDWTESARTSANYTWEALKSLAATQRAKQIQTQRSAIRETLDTIGFSRLANLQAVAAAERGAKQIVHTLIRLANVWRPIMQPSLFHSTLGTLVNEVLDASIKAIEGMQDIGEEDSKRINEVCKIFQGLEACFETPVGLHVPLWFKFVYLAEILEGSMVDIMYLVEEGSLVDYSAEELVSLVRALFSESPARQQNIIKIRQSLAIVSGRRVPPRGDAKEIWMGQRTMERFALCREHHRERGRGQVTRPLQKRPPAY